jgi:formate/nitrite transporter FocA (FNT family)
LGTIIGLAVALATAAPILLADSFQIAFLPTLIGILIGGLVFVALWKLAINQVNRLLTEIQV